MAKPNNRHRNAPARPTPFEECRDELFQHVIRCGVIGAEDDHATEWFDQTMQYMEERYPELSEEQLKELRTLGSRFAQPPKKQADSAA
jgi:hypothetical protein